MLQSVSFTQTTSSKDIKVLKNALTWSHTDRNNFPACRSSQFVAFLYLWLKLMFYCSWMCESSAGGCLRVYMCVWESYLCVKSNSYPNFSLSTMTACKHWLFAISYYIGLLQVSEHRPDAHPKVPRSWLQGHQPGTTWCFAPLNPEQRKGVFQPLPAASSRIPAFPMFYPFFKVKTSLVPPPWPSLWEPSSGLSLTFPVTSEK